MQFTDGASIDGPYTFGHEQGWHWSKNQGNHARGRDFFWVHWEISDGKPNHVKLHIESPKSEIDPELNAIKEQLVVAFLSPKISRLATQNGFAYKIGSRLKSEHIEKYRSTQAFQLILTPEQCKRDSRANIEMINEVLGQSVQEVIDRFTPQLNRQFEA